MAKFRHHGIDIEVIPFNFYCPGYLFRLDGLFFMSQFHFFFVLQEIHVCREKSVLLRHRH